MRTYIQDAKFIHKERFIPKIEDFICELNKVPHIKMSASQIDIYGLYCTNPEIIIKPTYLKSEILKLDNNRCFYIGETIKQIIEVANKFDLYKSDVPIKCENILRIVLDCGISWR